MSNTEILRDDNQQITLECDTMRLETSTHGAGLRRLYTVVDGFEEHVVTGYTEAAMQVGAEGDVLFPFPGRVCNGHYTLGDQTHQMPINDKQGPNAIHGFARRAKWTLVDHQAQSATLEYVQEPDSAPGYPFHLRIRISYTLSANGLTVSTDITNIGNNSAPAGVGFHPYFVVGDSLIDSSLLTVPMDAILEFDSGLIPTGKILPVDETQFDFRRERPIAKTVFDTCYCRPSVTGRTEVRLRSGSGNRETVVWMDGSFQYVVLFTGETLGESHRRRALAIEPMTCGSDAFNHPDWGLAVLKPGESLSGRWGVEIRRN